MEMKPTRSKLTFLITCVPSLHLNPLPACPAPILQLDLDEVLDRPRSRIGLTFFMICVGRGMLLA